MDAKERAAATYDAAADDYDTAALPFWDRFGRRTIERLALRPGARVLDVCAGTGSSALPAAEVVGPSGRVVAVDLAPKQLARAAAKARERGLANLECRVGDLETLPLDAGAFDAVVCVFGIFFLPDMAGALARLWSLVRPGGALAITTWGPALFEPASTIFWDAVHAVRPELDAFRPWERLGEPESVARLFVDGAGIVPAIETEPAVHPLAAPEDWWTIVLGSGFRAAVDRLTPPEQARVRDGCTSELRRRSVTAITAAVVYAVATKPATP